MRIHLIEGEEGCRLAVALNAVAVVVDALRASTTAAALLENGATSLWAVRTVEEAFQAKEEWLDALLFGERGGLPPEGFDYGNSPRETVAARGRRVVFTTTTGAGRLVSATGAREALMGTCVNDRAVARHLVNTMPDDVVFIPAGLAGDPGFDAQEDWVAATWLAELLASSSVSGVTVTLGEGRERYERYQRRIHEEGLEALFQSAPHAAKLRAVGLGADIAWCARTNCCSTVPGVVKQLDSGVLISNVAGR